jgi:CheY-like chemotaxis protein
MTSLRILLVDDHKDSLSVLAKLLGMQGHTICTATSFAEAVAVASREPCDLLVSDVGLPDRTGIELMQELRQSYGIKGIALTGHGDEQTTQDCLAAGFSTRLLKPVGFSELLDAIRDLEAPTNGPQRDAST